MKHWVFVVTYWKLLFQVITGRLHVAMVLLHIICHQFWSLGMKSYDCHMNIKGVLQYNYHHMIITCPSHNNIYIDVPFPVQQSSLCFLCCREKGTTTHYCHMNFTYIQLKKLIFTDPWVRSWRCVHGQMDLNITVFSPWSGPPLLPSTVQHGKEGCGSLL